jgi:hypothetical protein
MLVVALARLAMGGGVWGCRMSKQSRHYSGRAEVAPGRLDGFADGDAVREPASEGPW